MNENACFIALLSIEVHIPYAQSLKDKRQQIRGLKERIRTKFNASVAEIAYQDKWQRSVIAVCLVGSDKRQIESSCSKVESLCQEFTEISIMTFDQQWL